MTTIPPSSPLPPAPTSASPGVAAVITQLPPGLQSAGAGTVITGTVTAVTNQGQVLLQTNAGVVAFQSVASLSVGQQVSLQLQSSGAQLQALILSAKAQATAELVSVGLTADQPAAAVADAALPAALIAPSVTTGSVVVATVIASSAAGQSAPPASTAAELPPAGTSAPSLSSPSPAAPSAPGPAQPPSTGAAAAATGASTAASPSLPAPGPPAAGASTPASAPPPSQSQNPPAAPPGPSNTAGPTPVAAAGQPVPTPTTAPTAASPALPASGPGPATPTAAPALPPQGTPPASPMPSPLLEAQAAAATRPVSAAIASYAASSAAGAGNAASLPPPAILPGSVPLPTPPAGTQLPLRFIGPLPDLAAATASASNGQVVATVVARTPTGQMIVDTAIGRLAFTAPAADNVPVGSQIAFEIVAPALRPAAAALSANSAFAAGRGLAALTTEWPALKAALTALATIDPSLARQVIDAALPQLSNPRFVGQVLSFIAAAGDVKALLGQAAVDALQQAGRADVIARLGADLHEMIRLNTSASDWRVFYVPLLDSTEVRQLRVFTRRRRAGSDWTRDSGRFVVDVEFEHLGPLQLDGLVQKPRLDLILRSHIGLSEALQTGIAEVFGQTCAAAGLTGNIFFQAVPSFPVSPFDDMTKSSAPGLSV